MAQSPPSSRTTRPSTPYRTELARGAGSRFFSPPLELAYARLRLAENRTLIRVAAVLALLLAVGRGGQQIVLHVWTRVELCQYLVALLISVVLAVVAFSPWFERVYVRLAPIIVPIRNVAVAITVASTASHGHLESLMLLPLLVIGPFFVLGLRYRAALLAVVLTGLAYATAAAGGGLSLPLIVQSTALLSLVAVACGFVAQHLEHVSRRSFLEGHVIAELATRDALTGVKNRRVFDQQLDELWHQAIIQRCVLAILLIDVDHFKAYNDRFGHQAGDHALQRVAATLQSLTTRPRDVLARYGGEEFAVLLYDVDATETETLAEQMRRAVGSMALDRTGSAMPSSVTISIGVAIVEPSRERRPRGALQLADQALYRAKVGGRNLVEVLDQGAHEALETGVFTRSAGINS
jgi:diguanylate cyclase (GGDEF)-like protein